MRADILSGLGRYSVLLIGADGEPGDELPRISGPDGVLYLAPLPEERAKIASSVSDATDPRFGLPEFYNLTLSDERSLKFHWSRVIHVAEGLLDDDVFGKPRLRSCWNYLDDLAKIVGGGAEAAWKRMDPGLQLDLDPEVEMEADEESALADEVDEYLHGMRRVMRTRGVKMNVLAAQVTAFDSNANSLLKLISATTGIPHRILTGSERGELASSQDRGNWSDRIAERRREFGVPLVMALVDRLTSVGALPEPAEYEVIWPDAEELSESEKATVAGALASANQAQKASEGTVIVTADEIREGVLGLGPLEDVTDDGDDEDDRLPEEEGEEEEDELEALRGAGEFDLADTPAGEPEWKLVHRAADANRAGVAQAFSDAWDEAAEAIDYREVERHIAAGNVELAMASMIVGLQVAYDRLERTLPDRLLATLADGGTAATQFGRFSLAFNAVNPRAVEWAELRSAALITQIQPEIEAAMRSLIADSIAKGITVQRLVPQIRQSVGLRRDQVEAVRNLIKRMNDPKKFGKVILAGKTKIRIPASGPTKALVDKRALEYAARLRNQRARLIARTETMRSANAGQREAWLQASDRGELPTDQMRVWIATPDGRTRDSHIELDGEVTGINEPFPTGIEPGEEPNCRCSQGLATPEDLERAGLTS
jgi:SPP1 gp7 family putative phage head morphogenesis protein